MCWIIGWAIFGFFVGAIARMFWPGSRPEGCLPTILLGVAGSILGGLLTYYLTGGPERLYEPGGWIMSIIGALLLLWLFNDSRRPRGQY